MEVQTLQVTPEAATAALRYDRRDWEIERISREIAKGRRDLTDVEIAVMRGASLI